MNASMIRNRYVGDSVSTASPARLVTMLYDRLVLDLTNAESAIAGGDLAVANDTLVHALAARDLGSANGAMIHAQEIVWELAAGLDVTKWSGGPALAALYQFVLAELVAANVKKDAERVASARGLVEPLRDAWHQAAEVAAGTLTAVPA
jgi:flagellar protein FliS